MPRTGKIDPEFFGSEIATRLGADREDVRRGPAHGVDFGVIDVADRALVLATDPISILPTLGFERAGRFAVRMVLADAAVSGLPPSHLSISFTLPPGMTDEEFVAAWGAIHDECQDLGVQVVTGHTARYAECQFPWVGSATACAVGDSDEIVYPDGARPGDRLVITKGPAVETTGLLATLFPERIDLPGPAIATAQDRLDETDSVRDALTAAAAGELSAMHDATEGGLLGALHEMAASSGVRFVVDSDGVPVQPGVRDLCDALSMEPWEATTAGTLLIAVEPGGADTVVGALNRRGTPAGVAGRIESGSGVAVDGTETTPPDCDASWPVYERLLEES